MAIPYVRATASDRDMKNKINVKEFFPSGSQKA